MNITKIKTKTENETELPAFADAPNEDYSGEINNKPKALHPSNSSVFKTVTEYVVNAFQFLTVEPFLLCYVLPSALAATAIYNLNFYKACIDSDYGKEICDKVVSNDRSQNITLEALNKTQELLTNLKAWTNPVSKSIPAIMILFVGAWSDKTGKRKALMLIPLIGDIVTIFFLILASYYLLEWPLWATGLIETIPGSISGGTTIAVMGAFSYLADVTTVETRTFRLGIVTIIVSLAYPIGGSLSGILYKTLGYYGIFTISLIIEIVGFLHTYFRIHDVKRIDSEGTIISKVVLFFNPKNVWDTISLLVMARGRLLAQLSLIFCAHLIYMGSANGAISMLENYALWKYSIYPVEYSYFNAYKILMGIVGTTVAVTFISKKLKVHDALLGIIATASKVLEYALFAFSPTKLWFYAAPVVDFLGNSTPIAVRSLGTKTVKPNEVGKMCSILGLIEALSSILFTPMFAVVYNKTRATIPGTIYILGSILNIPNFFVLTTLYLLCKKQQRDEVKNPTKKELYAHDNAVTTL